MNFAKGGGLCVCMYIHDAFEGLLLRHVRYRRPMYRSFLFVAEWMGGGYLYVYILWVKGFTLNGG